LQLAQEWLLFGPETSGGLLVAVPPDQVNGFLTALGQGAWQIGEVTRGSGIIVE